MKADMYSGMSLSNAEKVTDSFTENGLISHVLEVALMLFSTPERHFSTHYLSIPQMIRCEEISITQNSKNAPFLRPGHPILAF